MMGTALINWLEKRVSFINNIWWKKVVCRSWRSWSCDGLWRCKIDRLYDLW